VQYSEGLEQEQEPVGLGYTGAEEAAAQRMPVEQ
jgi:hypothetical protein